MHFCGEVPNKNSFDVDSHLFTYSGLLKIANFLESKKSKIFPSQLLVNRAAIISGSLALGLQSCTSIVNATVKGTSIWCSSWSKDTHLLEGSKRHTKITRRCNGAWKCKITMAFNVEMQQVALHFFITPRHTYC